MFEQVEGEPDTVSVRRVGHLSAPHEGSVADGTRGVFVESLSHRKGQVGRDAQGEQSRLGECCAWGRLLCSRPLLGFVARVGRKFVRVPGTLDRPGYVDCMERPPELFDQA